MITEKSACANSSTALWMMPPGFGVALGQELVELLLPDLLGRRVADGIGAKLAQRLAPPFEHVMKSAAARLVADEAILVADLAVVAVHLDAREPLGAVRIEDRTLVSRLDAHLLRRDAHDAPCRLRP